MAVRGSEELGAWQWHGCMAVRYSEGGRHGIEGWWHRQ